MKTLMMNLPNPALEPKQQARILFNLGWKEIDIARLLGISQPTVNSWKRSEKWEEATMFEKIQTALEVRYTFLVIKPEKSDKELKELKELGKQVKDLIMPPKTRSSAAKLSSKDFDWDKFVSRINEGFNDLFQFQKDIITTFDQLDQNPNFSSEYLLGKTRQAGLTHTFSFYRLMRLINQNNNQIYISASKNQAYQARTYIQKFVKEYADIEIGGRDKMTFKPGLEFYFLAANPATAQGYSGDVTCDEFLWMPRFDELTKVVSACATQERYNVAYLSSASSKDHPGHAFFFGDKWNRKHPKNKIDTSYDLLRKGHLGQDGKFRQIITIHDAVAGGLNLVNIDKLRMQYDDESFRQLFEFEFFDSNESAFSFDEMRKCMVDALEEWTDWHPYENPHRPIGREPVAIGYDPARSHDGSAVSVLAVPNAKYPYFRSIEKHIWRGSDYDEQAEKIQKIVNRYNVVHFGIDAQGIGVPVAERVEKFFPNLVRYQSSIETKSQFVLQAKNNFKNKMLRMDHGDSDVVSAFLAIKKKQTPSGLVTYASSRSDDIAHSDISWAMMYAMGYQKLDGSLATARSSVFIN
ncbi:terminase large subunit domain-containing protein [Wohlfahrtiimonas larvae]|uniref:Terminase ATPase subunit family protein n=2 Tax=Wohlfahrtiimonas larvae TaxID=1157986 RepID=A0ABP9MJV7_9GAMM